MRLSRPHGRTRTASCRCRRSWTCSAEAATTSSRSPTTSSTGTTAWGRSPIAIRHSLNPESWKRYREEIARGGRSARVEDLRDAGSARRGDDPQHDQPRHLRPRPGAPGLNEFLPADGRSASRCSRRSGRAGAVSVACHPHEMSEFYANTCYLWNRRKLVGAAGGPLGGRLPLGPLPGRLAREAAAHRQQRLPPARSTSTPGRRCCRREKTVACGPRRSEARDGIGVLRLTSAAAEATA